MVEEQNIDPIPSPQPKFGLQNFNLKIILIGVIFLVIILLTFLFLFLANRAPKGKQVSTTPQITKTPGDSQKSTPAPKVTFRKYEKADNVNVSLPSTIKTHTLKTNFSIDEVKSFAQKFGLFSYETSVEDIVVFYNLSSINQKGLMSFDKKTGSFIYQSYGEFKLSNTPSQTLTEQASVILSELGFTDGTVSCEVTYKRRDAPPNTTFIECHRDWDKLGLPLINPVGVLNIAENKRLLSLKPGMTDPLSPKDAGVFSVNTGDDGVARPNDFNTISIALFDDGNIYMISSNLRWMISGSLHNNQSILSQEEALSLFSGQRATFSLTVPAGRGVFDWDKVYPDNQASAKRAVIQDIELVYIEKSQENAQDSYSPHYLIRGVAELDSGYTVRFSEMLPALKSEQNKDVAGNTSYIAQEKNLQLKTFNPLTPTSVKPTMPITSPPTKTSPPTGETSQCLDTSGTLNNPNAKTENLTIEVPGYGTANLIYGAHTFYLKSASFSNIDMKKIREALYKEAENQYVINVAHYLKKNPKDQPSTQEEAYKLFNKVNNAGADLPTCASTLVTLPRPAPYTKACAAQFAGIALTFGQFSVYDMPSALKITESAAKRIVDAGSRNQIESIASQKDIFAPKTNMNLPWVFVLSSREMLSAAQGKASCYVSGVSPLLFLYPDAPGSFSVKTSAPLTYSDPPAKGNSWNVTAYPDGTISTNSVTRPYIYYEYDPSKVNFVEQNEGFVLETSAVESFISETLAPKFGLNTKESDALLSDVKKELINETNPFVKISIIEEGAIDKNLPLSISPAPANIQRIHLFINPLKTGVNIQPQKIKSLERGGFTVIEFGVFKK